MKKIFTLTLVLVMLSTLLIPVNVFASSYSDNYYSFVNKHQNGSTYTPTAYSKTRALNELFVEEFYENVFLPISLLTIKPINDLPTNASTAEFVAFFDELYAGDIIRLDNSYYAIYISHTKDAVTLYSVGTPLTKVDSANIALTSYKFSAFPQYAKNLISYQVNTKNYNILTKSNTSGQTFTDWGMPNIKSNVLTITKGTEVPISVINYYKDGSGEESVADYNFDIKDETVAFIRNNKTLIAKEVGLTFLSAKSKSGNYPPPDDLQIKVVNESTSSYKSYWDMNEVVEDTLYAKTGEEIEIRAVQKRGTTMYDITSQLNYKISDTSIAYIKGKKIIPLKTGETMLSASSYSADVAAPSALLIKVNYDSNNNYIDNNTPGWSADSLSGTTMTLEIGETSSFSLYIVKNNKKIDVTTDFMFSSRNPSVATVSGNKITAINNGTTTITATRTTGTLSTPRTLTVIVTKDEYTDPTQKNTQKDDKNTRNNQNATQSSYYTFWTGPAISKDNVLELYVGQSVNMEVYLQSGLKQKDVTEQVSMSVDDKSIAYLKNSNVLTAAREGTTTLHGVARGNFAPSPEDITVKVTKNVEYSKDNQPIWTIASIDGDRVRINLSNYTARIITTGTISSVGLNDTTNYMTFATRDENIAKVSKENTLIPVSVGTTYLYATSRFAKDVIPEPILVEVYNDTTEDGAVFITIDGELPEVLRLSVGESVPFEISIFNKDGYVDENTESLLDNIKISGNSVSIKDGMIYGKQLGESTLYVDIPNMNLMPLNLNVQVRELDRSKALSGFPDVPNSFWGYEYILKLTKYGVINGFEDGTFRPNDYVTAEQAMKLIVTSAKIKKISANDTYDKRIGIAPVPIIKNVSDWAERYVSDGSNYIDSENAFASGFEGTAPISRIQAMSLLDRASNLESGNINLMETFSDLKTWPDWAFSIVGNLAYNKVVEGDEAGNLNPSNILTRAEMCKLLYKTFFEE